MGVWGEPGFVRPSSVRREAETRTFRIAKKGQVAKKNETADDGGGSVSPRPTARYPNPRPRPTPPTAKYGIAKNGELLGPKVKAQLALEARGHVPNADDGSAFVRFGTDAELLIYVSSQLLFLRAEHLDVGFMLSGFRRRHKVSQRPVCVLGRLPRRERRVSKVTKS